MTIYATQSEKQTYGCRCDICGELWDGYQVPCKIDVALRIMEANRTCPHCGSAHVMSLMPWRYEELKAEKRAKEQDA